MKTRPPDDGLLSQLHLISTDFSGPSTMLVTRLFSVIAVEWVAIRAIDFFAFLRGHDGNFNFKIDDENLYAAHRVSVFQSIREFMY